MANTVLVFAKLNKPAAIEARDRLVQWLQKKSVPVLDVSATLEKLTEAELKGVKLGVVIGGDGTFLTLVRKLERKDQFPLLGVNLGTLGFITETNKEEMLPAVEHALANKFREELRPLLDVEVWRGNDCVVAGVVFNDAVMTKDAQTSMLKFDVFLGGELLSAVRADGYIAATPTGSTAYALSAGGPILHPEVNGIVLVPICSHALSARPMIVSQDSKIEMIPREIVGTAYLVFDGHISFEIKTGDKIKIHAAQTKLRLYKAPEQKWSETVRTKLKMV